MGEPWWRVAQTGVRGLRGKVVEYAFMQGPRRGRTVVAIHCSGSSYKQWTRLAKRLVEEEALGVGTVVAPNLFGSGLTSKWPFPTSRPLTLDDQAALVASAVEAVERDGDIIIGHSHGASVATRLATTRGCEKLVVFEPNYLVLNEHCVGFEEAKKKGTTFLEAMARSGLDDFRDWGPLFYDFWFSQHAQDTWDNLDQDTRRKLLGTTVPHTWHEVNSLLLARGPSSQADLEALAKLDGHLVLSHTPGRGSSLPLHALAHETLSFFQVSTLPVGGHLAPISHPDDFADHIIQHCLSPPSS